MTAGQQNQNIYDKMGALRDGAGGPQLAEWILITGVAALGVWLIYRALTRGSVPQPTRTEKRPAQVEQELLPLDGDAPSFKTLETSSSHGLSTSSPAGRIVRRVMVVEAHEDSVLVVAEDTSPLAAVGVGRLMLQQGEKESLILDVSIQEEGDMLRLQHMGTPCQRLLNQGHTVVSCRAVGLIAEPEGDQGESESDAEERGIRIRVTEATLDGIEFIADQAIEPGARLQLRTEFEEHADALTLGVEPIWVEGDPGGLWRGGFKLTEGAEDWRVFLCDHTVEVLLEPVGS